MASKYVGEMKLVQMVIFASKYHTLFNVLLELFDTKTNNCTLTSLFSASAKYISISVYLFG
jgi:hypothetical protein